MGDELFHADGQTEIAKITVPFLNFASTPKNEDLILLLLCSPPPRRCFHLIVVRRFEYASDPESYPSGSVATGRASLAGQVKG